MNQLQNAFLHVTVLVRFIVICFSVSCLTLFSFQPAQATAVRHRVSAGDTVYSILKRNGFSDAQRNMALGASSIPESFVLSEGQPYFIVNSEKGARKEILFFSSSSMNAYSFWRESNSAGGKVTQPVYDIRKGRAEGIVRGSIVESIAKIAGDDLIAYRFIDAFVLDYDLPRLLRRGAHFSLDYEKIMLNGQLVRTGNILSATLEINDRRISRQFIKAGNGGFFVDKKNTHKDRPLYAPVNHVRISSLFQKRRFHPIKKYRKAHEGIDFEGESGSPIYAANTGRIIRFGRNRAAGNFVVMRHDNGLETYYNHMETLSSQLRNGLIVKAGTRLGSMGCTGYCTKPHLHFAVKSNNQFVNPINKVRFYSYTQKKDVENYFSSID
jgi:murein DD-endopeptidase MepM/ murein hydrolase activator NlpD